MKNKVKFLLISTLIILIGFPTFIWAGVMLDTSFNGIGYVTHNNAAGGNKEEHGYSIKVDSNGKILVGGYSENASNNDMVIWRYNSNGTFDTSFNGRGYVIHNNAAGGNNDDRGLFGIVTDSNGKILVCGDSKTSNSNYDMVIWRYNNNGTLDTSFNGTGYVAHNNAAGGNSDDSATNITIDANNKILVTGYSTNNAGNWDMAIWRYNSNGILDTSFNGTGYVIHNNAAGGNSIDIGYGIKVDSNGKIWVTGISYNTSNNGDAIIWRYNNDGTLDTSFNGTGYVISSNVAGGNGEDGSVDMTIDKNGKILLVGISKNTSNDFDMVLWRYNSNGTLDTSFNGTGYVAHNNAAGGNKDDYAISITIIDNNNKILATGYSRNTSGNDDMVIWKYNDIGTLDTSFNKTGYIVHNNAAGGNKNDYGRSIVIDSSGRILVSGYSTNVSNNSDMTIWRYTFSETTTVDTTKDNNITFETGIGQIKLEIPAGTFSDNCELTLKIPEVPAYNKTEWISSGISVEISINNPNLTIQKEMKLTMSYPSTLALAPTLVSGLNKNKLKMGYYSDSLKDWIPVVNSTVNTDENKVVGNVKSIGIYQIFEMSTTTSDFSTLKVYPNPFIPSRHSRINFVGLTANATIIIYTLTGEKVNEVIADSSGTAYWDGRNTGGNMVGSGIYFGYIYDGASKKIVKIAIER